MAMPSNNRPWWIPGLRWFRESVLSRPWAAFLVFGIAFFAFGVGTLNLFMLLHANVVLITEHGWQAAMDGGLQQLAELLLIGYASVAAYLVARLCEDSLVRRLGNAEDAAGF